MLLFLNLTKEESFGKEVNRNCLLASEEEFGLN